jgi:hypothetical protein
LYARACAVEETGGSPGASWTWKKLEAEAGAETVELLELGGWRSNKLQID